MTVEKTGFKKAVAGPIQVNIQGRVSVDLKLDPGTATEVVNVTGGTGTARNRDFRLGPGSR